MFPICHETAMAGQSQNLCVFLFCNKRVQSCHTNISFLSITQMPKVYQAITGLRCREETAQRCRTYFVPISSLRSWKRPLQSAHRTEDTVTELSPLLVWWLQTLPKAQCPWSDFCMDPAQTLPPEISQVQMCSGCLVMSIFHQTLLFRPHGSPRLYMSMYFRMTGHNASAELALLFLVIKSRTASLHHRGPEIHHWSHSPFWSTAREVY